MEYPKNGSLIVEVRRSGGDHWSTALFYWNGKRPVFAQYGSEIHDVTEWRRKKKQKK